MESKTRGMLLIPTFLVMFAIAFATVDTFATVDAVEEAAPEYPVIRNGVIINSYGLHKAARSIQQMSFHRQQSTGLCFGYIWGGMANGGPGIVLLPCSTIPAELLITGTEAN